MTDAGGDGREERQIIRATGDGPIRYAPWIGRRSESPAEEEDQERDRDWAATATHTGRARTDRATERRRIVKQFRSQHFTADRKSTQGKHKIPVKFVLVGQGHCGIC